MQGAFLLSTLVLGVLAMAVTVVDANECQLQYVNGCSIPLNLPYFYKDTFKPACNRHDICYQCGSSNRYQLSRKKCDDIFKRNMDSICKKRKSWFQRFTCSIFKNDYYSNVRRWGFGSYKYNSPSWCKESRVRRCMY